MVPLKRIIINRPEHEEAWAASQAWRAEGNFPSPHGPEPIYVPGVISDRQFFEIAAMNGLVTMDEVLAAVQTGAILAILQTIVDGTPMLCIHTSVAIILLQVLATRSRPF
jgi:hypothetical protein